MIGDPLGVEDPFTGVTWDHWKAQLFTYNS